MGFHVEINSILRSDDAYKLARGSEHGFVKSGSRIFFDDIPIWLCKSDWTALAEIRVLQQLRTSESIVGRFRVLRVYDPTEQAEMTSVFRRMYAAESDPNIYLLLSRQDAETFRASAIWDPPSRAADGFIHASPAKQLSRVANKHYTQFDEVVVLALRLERIQSELKWEPATGGLYPHVYGPINYDAVVREVVVRKSPAGVFDVVPGSVT